MPIEFPYVAPIPTSNIVVSVGGVVRSGTTAFIEMATIKVKDNLNEQPNTCSLVARGFTPTYGQEILIGLGSLDPNVLIFGGHVTDAIEGYDLVPGATLNVFWSLTCMDYVWLLNRRRPIANFAYQPADQILASLMSGWGAGFTLSCPSGLASLAISFNGSRTMAQCITDVTNSIGYHWKVNYAKQVRIFTTDTGTAPTTIDLSNTVTQANPNLTYNVNIDQMRNLVTGYGISTQLLGDIALGETIIPINSIVGFDAAGGQSLVGFINNTYTGIQLGGTGVFVGPGASPSSPCVGVATIGAGLGLGLYTYAYTYVTASGESLPSPLATVTTFTLPDNTTAPTFDFTNWTNNGTFSYNPGDTVDCAVANSGGATALNQTNVSNLSPIATFTAIAAPGPGGAAVPGIAWTPSTDPNVKWTHIYRRINGGTWFLITGFAPPSNGPIVIIGSAPAGGAYSGPNSASQQVSLSAISVGGSPTSSRKIYRTVVGGSQLKLQSTIGNNTATTLVDSTADGSLGANAPTSDTSGLSSGSGQVLLGASTMVVSGIGPFSATGGWARVGSIVFRYAGISGNTLTGIPTSGAGSLTASVNYGSTIIAAPALVGVTGINTGITAGAIVAIRVTTSNPASIALMAAAEGGDGVHEFVFYDNSILTVAALSAQVQANLTLYSLPIVELVEAGRDINTISGRAITVNLPAPLNISVVVLIQSVEITHIGTEQNAFPLYTARASSVKFTLQDLLRQLGGLLTAP